MNGKILGLGFALAGSVFLSSAVAETKGIDERNIQNYETCADYVEVKAAEIAAGTGPAGVTFSAEQKKSAGDWFRNHLGVLRKDFDEEQKAKAAKKGAKASRAHLPRIIARSFEPCEELMGELEYQCKSQKKDGPHCKYVDYLDSYKFFKPARKIVYDRAFRDGKDACLKNRMREAVFTGATNRQVRGTTGVKHVDVPSVGGQEDGNNLPTGERKTGDGN